MTPTSSSSIEVRKFSLELPWPCVKPQEKSNEGKKLIHRARLNKFSLEALEKLRSENYIFGSVTACAAIF